MAGKPVGSRRSREPQQVLSTRKEESRPWRHRTKGPHTAQLHDKRGDESAVDRYLGKHQAWPMEITLTSSLSSCLSSAWRWLGEDTALPTGNCAAALRKLAEHPAFVLASTLFLLV